MKSYISLMILAILLFGWTIIRTWHYKKEKRKQRLQDRIQALKKSPVEKNKSSKNYLYATGRILAILRGYAGFTAAFGATIFPPIVAGMMIKILGTMAVCSVYIENIVESFRLNREIKIKSQINALLIKKNGDIDESSLVSLLPKPAIVTASATTIFGIAILFFASPQNFGFENFVPASALPVSIILSSLSFLFTNRFYNNALRKRLAAYNKENNIMTKSATSFVNTARPSRNKRLFRQEQHKIRILGSTFQVSATARGIVATILTVSIFFNLSLEAMRSLGGAILGLNFLETIIETYLIKFENRLLEQEHEAIDIHHESVLETIVNVHA